MVFQGHGHDKEVLNSKKQKKQAPKINFQINLNS